MTNEPTKTLATTYPMYCADCGTQCQQTGTNGFRNSWCFTCLNPEHQITPHWMRYGKRIEFIKQDECDICRENTMATLNIRKEA